MFISVQPRDSAIKYFLSYGQRERFFCFVYKLWSFIALTYSCSKILQASVPCAVALRRNHIETGGPVAKCRDTPTKPPQCLTTSHMFGASRFYLWNSISAEKKTRNEAKSIRLCYAISINAAAKLTVRQRAR